MKKVSYKHDSHCNQIVGNYGSPCIYHSHFQSGGGITSPYSYFYCRLLHKEVMVEPFDGSYIANGLDYVLLPDECPLISDPNYVFKQKLKIKNPF